MMKELWDHNTSLQKYISLFISQKVQNSVSVRETGRWRETSRGLLYWPFHNPRCDSIFGALCPCFLDERFSTRFCQGTTWFLLPLGTYWLWLTVTLLVPVYIWFHDASAFWFSFWMSTHVICIHPCIACFPVITLFTQLEYPVPEIPDWRLCQRSVMKQLQINQIWL